MVFCLNRFPTLAGLPLPLERDLLGPLPFGVRRACRTVCHVSEALEEVTAPACFSPTPEGLTSLTAPVWLDRSLNTCWHLFLSSMSIDCLSPQFLAPPCLT